MAERLDLDAIAARANVATEGPWESAYENGGLGAGAVVWGPPGSAHAMWGATRGTGEQEYGPLLALADGEYVDNPNANADGVFIAHARTDVPALVARVRELEKALREAKIRHMYYECTSLYRQVACDCGAAEHNAKIDAVLGPSTVEVEPHP